MASTLTSTGCFGGKGGSKQDPSSQNPSQQGNSSEDISQGGASQGDASDPGDSEGGPTSHYSEEEEPLSAAKLKVRFHVDERSAEGKAYKKLIEAFNKDYSSYNIKATADFVARTAGDSAYERQLAQDMMDGTLPDVITFDAPNCAAYAYEETEYLYDLTDELSEDYKKCFTTLNTYQGRVYGVPIQESSAGFYYNKNIFAQAGIDVSGITVDNPWTYSEFKTACQKLAAAGVIPVDMRMDATKDETATYLLYPFIYASGGSFVDSTGLQAIGYFNSDASKRGFQFLKDLLTANYTSYGIGATDFFTGKVGMYLSSGWTIPDLDNAYKTTFPDRNSWGLLPYPKDVTSASANGSWSFAIGNNGKNTKKQAIALLKYLTRKESSKTITDATGMIPANKEVETNYEANSPEDVLIQQLNKTGMARPETIGYPQFSAAFSQVISSLGSQNVSTLVDNKAQSLQNDLNKL